MTKDEAFKRINDAISDNKAAAQISTALDALGLLNLGRLAYQPGFHPPGVEPEDISKADPQPAYARPTLPPDTPAGSFATDDPAAVAAGKPYDYSNAPPADFVPDNPSKRQRDWAEFRERER